ncbi:aryl-phospho-beta-D-glucosidase BglC (GH1 family) [Saonia flava]|uniref:Aryl-phospho-beta-D-glucosidase BglC (GH1 family) n=1 Tax=Saonia flava TaxID=523696 RepID=A0A846R025_9FLAO|nr:cellulase family glycosylhydrolase [Saonia flava]NJB71265.1 aryl-phospho-beta-D-glucosidase BglC (GH1 family) [Saonia flava]
MADFLHTSGTKILNENNEQVFLRGVGMGNQVWETENVPLNHHSEIDYERIKDMGMNAVRFYINLGTLQEDVSPFNNKVEGEGWKWLDQNIAWAKKYDIYLILNLHIVPGGFQSMGDGDALWKDAVFQQKITSFWKKVAKKYKNKSQIAGFGLLNEPVPTDSIAQWQSFAQHLVDEIRKIDKNHIVFVERCREIKGNPEEDINLNFPLLKGDNLVYEFHTFQPYGYTHQLLEWAGLGDKGSYPDLTITQYINELNGANITQQTAYKRDKSYLKAVIERFVKWGSTHEVPLYMGEFGSCIPSFKNGKGGLEWVRDMLTIAHKNNLSYTYHAYHEDSYGLYYGAKHLPAPEASNKELIDLFKSVL